MNIRKRKKILLSAACIVLVLSVSACAMQQPLVSDETATATKEAEQSTTTEQTVATTTETEKAVKTTRKTTVRKTTTTKSEKVKMSPLKASFLAVKGWTGNTENIKSNMYPLWDSRIDQTYAPAPKTKTISFEEKTYTGEYVESFIRRYENYQTDVYDYGEDLFYVNAQTGELEAIHLPEGKKGDKSKAECQKIAFALADKHINRKECSFESKTLSDGTYRFKFCKLLENILTTEEVSVDVSSSGEIVVFHHFMKGCFSAKELAYSALNQQKIRALNTEKAEALALKAVKDAYPEHDTQTVEEKRWVMLENGELGMMFICKTSRKDETSDLPLPPPYGFQATSEVLVK